MPVIAEAGYQGVLKLFASLRIVQPKCKDSKGEKKNARHACVWSERAYFP